MHVTDLVGQRVDHGLPRLGRKRTPSRNHVLRKGRQVRRLRHLFGNQKTGGHEVPNAPGAESHRPHGGNARGAHGLQGAILRLPAVRAEKRAAQHGADAFNPGRIEVAFDVEARLVRCPCDQRGIGGAAPGGHAAVHLLQNLVDARQTAGGQGLTVSRVDMDDIDFEHQRTPLWGRVPTGYAVTAYAVTGATRDDTWRSSRPAACITMSAVMPCMQRRSSGHEGN